MALPLRSRVAITVVGVAVSVALVSGLVSVIDKPTATPASSPAATGTPVAESPYSSAIAAATPSLASATAGASVTAPAAGSPKTTPSSNATVSRTTAPTPKITARVTATPAPTPAPTPPQPTPPPTAAATPTRPPAPAVTIIAAGDTRTDLEGIQATTALIMARPGIPVLNVGDDTDDGSAALYADFFNPNWGQFKNRILPTPGNHEYDTAGAAPYFAYYGAAAGSPSRSWYSFNIGSDWHGIELNGNIAHGAGSPQEQFLKADLAANAGKHIIAFWHEPRFSSGSEHGSDDSFTPFWTDLYAAHAEIVLNGHDHDYERFGLQNPSGGADPNGIREFVVGTGGAPLYAFGGISANSQARNDNTWGILMLTLNANSYSWKFIPQAGKSFTDSGTQATHS